MHLTGDNFVNNVTECLTNLLHPSELPCSKVWNWWQRVLFAVHLAKERQADDVSQDLFWQGEPADTPSPHVARPAHIYSRPR
mmetsp:Transcript_66498/g.110580  ORF Transcript_66498/g.110580 Transcript_66498/m.110580 type:complete len:82 (-) Transcript_66498:94-339(-)